MKTTIKSRDLLAEAGVSVERKPRIPLNIRPLLITSVVWFVSGKKLQQILKDHGNEVSLREVLDWQYATREWLGLPQAGRGKPSIEYQNKVKTWLEENGNPTPEAIDAGWVPPRMRHNPALESGRLPQSHHSRMEKLVAQINSLDAAEDDDKVRLLLSQYVGELHL